ncbi:MAG: hypothetical protein WAS51_05860 [Ilumatobacteraceae bacterium]|nr:MAG: hypothetical protein IPM43_07825 [Actinomycetota bacterium]
MFALLRKVARPFTRTALIAFTWSHRHEVLRWGRSFWLELRRGPLDLNRLYRLGRVLWHISADETLAGAKQLRIVRIDGDSVVLDTEPGWRGTPRLVMRLHEVGGVNRIVDSVGRELSPAIAAVA